MRLKLSHSLRHSNQFTTACNQLAFSCLCLAHGHLQFRHGNFPIIGRVVDWYDPLDVQVQALNVGCQAGRVRTYRVRRSRQRLGWRVEPSASSRTFSFGRYAMSIPSLLPEIRQMIELDGMRAVSQDLLFGHGLEFGFFGFCASLSGTSV